VVLVLLMCRRRGDAICDGFADGRQVKAVFLLAMMMAPTWTPSNEMGQCEQCSLLLRFASSPGLSSLHKPLQVINRARFLTPLSARLKPTRRKWQEFANRVHTISASLLLCAQLTKTVSTN